MSDEEQEIRRKFSEWSASEDARRYAGKWVAWNRAESKVEFSSSRIGAMYNRGYTYYDNFEIWQITS